MPGPEMTILKKQLPIIYMIDTSGSMGGDRIAAVNDAMREAIKVMKEQADSSPDAEIKVGVLQFSTGAKWVTNGLVDLEHFYWDDLSATGLTDFGSALKELDSKLSKNSYLKSDIGYAVPVIICMSDGQPTDSWEKTFDEVKKKNAWFRGAKKACIAIGDDADIDMLGRLCGNPKEGVIKVSNLEALKGFIVAVSATASMMGQSQMVTEDGEKVESTSFVDTVIDNMSGDTSGVDVITDDDVDWGDDGSDIGMDTPDDDIWN